MGILYSAWAGFWHKVAPVSAMSHTFWPPPLTYSPQRDVPDQTGKVAVITGGASGIGYQTAKQLLIKNAKVYIAGRNLNKVNEAIGALEKETTHRAHALELDLGDLTSCAAAGKAMLAKEPRIDILICCAGVMRPPNEQLTGDGYDLQFGTNVVGHYLFNVILLPALEVSAKAGGPKSRVVQITSAGHFGAPGNGIEWSSLRGGPERDAHIKKWGKVAAPWTLYGQSKMGNVLVANVLDRLHHEHLVSSSVHPGIIASDIHRHEPGWEAAIMGPLSWPLEYGAFTPLYAATAPETEGAGGKHFYPWARLGQADKRSDNVELQDELKAWLDNEIKDYTRK